MTVDDAGALGVDGCALSAKVGAGVAGTAMVVLDGVQDCPHSLLQVVVGQLHLPSCRLPACSR